MVSTLSAMASKASWLHFSPPNSSHLTAIVAFAATVLAILPRTHLGERDGVVAPTVEKGWPAAAVYVDNALIIGSSGVDAARGVRGFQDALGRRSLLYHDAVDPCQFIVYVGIEIDIKNNFDIKHTSARTRRLYQAVRYIKRIGICTSLNLND